MSVFGANPIHPLPAQAALAAQQQLRPTDRGQPSGDATRRMKDVLEQRIAGTESENAVRSTVDEHAQEESEEKQERRDGRRDGFTPTAPNEDSAPTSEPPTTKPGPRLDLRI